MWSARSKVGAAIQRGSQRQSGSLHHGKHDFAVEWHDHAYSQQALGHTETSRQLEIRLRRCHPTNRPKVASELAAARAGKGPTVFDWLVKTFYEQVPGVLTLR